jgi:uncharacterized protein (TIGR02118 family)
MISVCVLYPRTESSRFNMEYYVTKHMPMAIKGVGSALKGVTVEAGVAGTEEGSPPANAAVCRLLLDSIEAFLTAFGPRGEASGRHPELHRRGAGDPDQRG